MVGEQAAESPSGLTSAACHSYCLPLQLSFSPLPISPAACSTMCTPPTCPPQPWPPTTYLPLPAPAEVPLQLGAGSMEHMLLLAPAQLCSSFCDCSSFSPRVGARAAAAAVRPHWGQRQDIFCAPCTQLEQGLSRSWG